MIFDRFWCTLVSVICAPKTASDGWGSTTFYDILIKRQSLIGKFINRGYSMFFKKRGKITEEPPPRETPEIKGAPLREPYYPDGKFPLRHSAPRMMPPIENMPPKPPGTNRKR